MSQPLHLSAPPNAKTVLKTAIATTLTFWWKVNKNHALNTSKQVLWINCTYPYGLLSTFELQLKSVITHKVLNHNNLQPSIIAKETSSKQTNKTLSKLYTQTLFWQYLFLFQNGKKIYPYHQTMTPGPKSVHTLSVTSKPNLQFSTRSTASHSQKCTKWVSQIQVTAHTAPLAP